MEHCPRRHNQHNKHREKREPDRLVAAQEIEDDDHERQSRQELIRRAEEGPERQSTTTRSTRSLQQGDSGSEHQSERCCGVTIRQRLEVNSVRQFVDNIPLEPRCCIERGGSETRNKHRHNRNAHLQRNPKRSKEVSTPINKRTHLRFKCMACPTTDDTCCTIGICYPLTRCIASSPRLLIGKRGCAFCLDNRFKRITCAGTRTIKNPHTDTRTAGENDNNSKTSFKQHRAVADVLCVAFRCYLFARSTGTHHTVETANGTARNGNKQEGPDRWRVWWNVRSNSRRRCH